MADGMKLEMRNHWVRVLIEFFPALPPIRRYRVSPHKQEANTRRHLRRHIARNLRLCAQEHTAAKG
jgi:hypothetical protein